MSSVKKKSKQKYEWTVHVLFYHHANFEMQRELLYKMQQKKSDRIPDYTFILRRQRRKNLGKNINLFLSRQTYEQILYDPERIAPVITYTFPLLLLNSNRNLYTLSRTVNVHMKE
jgi:hypothetical protein